MEEQDLREIGISDPQHRRKLLQAARSLPKVMPAAQPLPEPGPIPPGPRAGSELGSGVSALVLGVPEGGRVLFMSLPSPEARRDRRTGSGLRTGAGICPVWEPGAQRLGPQRPSWSLLNHPRPGQPVPTPGVFPWGPEVVGPLLSSPVLALRPGSPCPSPRPERRRPKQVPTVRPVPASQCFLVPPGRDPLRHSGGPSANPAPT